MNASLMMTVRPNGDDVDATAFEVAAGAGHLRVEGPGVTVHLLPGGELIFGRRVVVRVTDYAPSAGPGESHAEMALDDACRLLSWLRGLGAGWMAKGGSPGLVKLWATGDPVDAAAFAAEAPKPVPVPPPVPPPAPAPAPKPTPEDAKFPAEPILHEPKPGPEAKP